MSALLRCVALYKVWPCIKVAATPEHAVTRIVLVVNGYYIYSQYSLPYTSNLLTTSLFLESVGPVRNIGTFVFMR